MSEISIRSDTEQSGVKGIPKRAIIASFLSGLIIVGVHLYTDSMGQNTLRNQDDIFPHYLQFIAKYGKTRQNEKQFWHRFEIFKQNYQRVVNHNAIPDSGFELEINQFADLTDEEFVATHTGLRVPQHKTNSNKGKSVPIETVDKRRRLKDIPEYKNWYKEGAVTKPYDQGACGGCWAFSSVSAVESLAFINGVNKPIKEFSVQQVLDCDDDNYGCTGGWMYQGFTYIGTNGALFKEDYAPFTQMRHICATDSELLKEKGHMTQIGYIERDRRDNTELKQILQKNTVSMSIYTTGMMGAYKNGVMTEEFLKCSYPDREVNHGVVMVGYGKVTAHDRVRGRCKEFWIIRNSWGTSWGDDGFFRLCSDDAGTPEMPFGTCLANKYATWPTMSKDDIDPDFVP